MLCYHIWCDNNLQHIHYAVGSFSCSVLLQIPGTVRKFYFIRLLRYYGVMFKNAKIYAVGNLEQNGAELENSKNDNQFFIEKCARKIMQSKYFDTYAFLTPFMLCYFTTELLSKNFIEKCRKNRVFETYLEIRFFNIQNSKSTKIVSKILKF